MSKNTAKSYAEEGLEAVTEDTAAAEANVSSNAIETGEMVEIGGLEPLAYFYRFNAPKNGSKSPFKIIEKGTVIEGTYERSFITKGKYGEKTTYVVKLNDGKLVGLPSAGKLEKQFAKLAEGSKVKVIYDGMDVIKGGQWAGSDSHVFRTFGNKLKA